MLIPVKISKEHITDYVYRQTRLQTHPKASRLVYDQVRDEIWFLIRFQVREPVWSIVWIEAHWEMHEQLKKELNALKSQKM